RLDPNDLVARAAYNLARGWVECEREIRACKKAIAEATKAIEANPNDAKAYLRRARARAEISDVKGAISDYGKALKIDPSLQASVGSALADLYLSRGIGRFFRLDFDGALKAFTKAIKYKPKFPEAYYNRGLVFRIKRDFDSAIKDWEKALRILNNSPLKGLLEYQRLLEETKHALAAAYNNRIVFMCIDKWVEDYGKRLSNLLRLGQGNVGGLDKGELGKIDIEQAIADFSRAIELAPELPEPYFNRALFRERKGDLTGALQDLEKYVRLVPNPDPLVREKVSNLRKRLGKMRTKQRGR
ncbi:MAG: hypothetical protein DRP63_04730, partial [Planctomycetota bacterium]